MPPTVFFRSLLALSLSGALPATAANVVALTSAQKANLGIASVPAVPASTGPALTHAARVTLVPTGVRVIAAAGDAMVTRLHVQPGDAVVRGAPLVSLSMPGLAETQHLLAQARVRAELATDQVSRDEKLFGEGLIAESRLRIAQAEAKAASAGLAAAQRALSWQGQGRISGSGITLTAPIAGVVTESTAEPGQRVDAGMPLMKLADLSQLALEIPLSPAQARQVAVGQRVNVAGSAAEGRITALLPQINAAQSVLARASLSDPQRTLRPGQAVQAGLAGSSMTRSLEVPAAALAWQGQHAHVFVETAQGYVPTPVQVLRRNASQAEVTGLASGSRVAVRGVAALKAQWLGE
ncbi:MAG: efflux RND transporter periplasmic adaptor subunit [Gammaproteobacteria bacterium]